MKKRTLTVFVVLACVLPLLAGMPEPEPPTLTGLLERVEELEARVAELEELVAPLREQAEAEAAELIAIEEAGAAERAAAEEAEGAAVEEVEGAEAAERAAAEEAAAAGRAAAEERAEAEATTAEAEAELDEVAEAIEDGNLDRAESGLDRLDAVKDSLPETLVDRMGDLRRLLDAAKLAREAREVFSLP